MSNAEKEACRKSVNELHLARVLHGDLHSRNFLIVKNIQRKRLGKFCDNLSYLNLCILKIELKAYIIDFGRSKVVKTWQRKPLINEMRELDQNLI